MITGPGGAFTLTALELLIGTYVLMLLGTRLWPVISRGHWRATTWSIFPLVAALALVMPASLKSLALVVAGLMILHLVAIYSQRPLLEWITSLSSGVGSIYLLISAGMSTCDGFCASGIVQVFAGAMFLGALTHGMALGHWYLNQPRLPIDPLLASTYLLFASLLAPLALGLIDRTGLSQGVVVSGLLIISSNTYWWAWLVLLATVGFIGLMIVSTVKSRSTQSATGLLYVAMVPALGAQFLLTLLFLT